MSNPYYTKTGNPLAQTRGLSSQIRNEFTLIEFGFDGINSGITGKADINSPAFTGTPTAPTPTAGDASTKLATTAFVDSAFAKINSPAFTGTPTAPTPSAGDSSTKLATTAFAAGLAFQAALPAQSGSSGAVVTTNGATASWAQTPTTISTSTYTLAQSGKYDVAYAGACAMTAPVPVNGALPIVITMSNGRTDNTIDFGAYSVYGPVGSTTGVLTLDTNIPFELVPVAGAWRIK